MSRVPRINVMMVSISLLVLLQPGPASADAVHGLLRKFGLGQSLSVFMGSKPSKPCQGGEIVSQPVARLLWFLDEPWTPASMMDQMGMGNTQQSGLVLKDHHDGEGLGSEIAYGVVFVRSTHRWQPPAQPCASAHYLTELALGNASTLTLQLAYSSPLMKKIAERLLGQQGTMEESLEAALLLVAMFPGNVSWDLSMSLSTELYDADALGVLMGHHVACNREKNRPTCSKFMDVFRSTHATVALLERIDALRDHPQGGLAIFGRMNLSQKGTNELRSVMTTHDRLAYELNAAIYALPPELLRYKASLEGMRQRLATIRGALETASLTEIQGLQQQLRELDGSFQGVRGMSKTFSYCQGLELTDPEGVDHFLRQFSLIDCLEFVTYLKDHQQLLDTDFLQQQATWRHAIMLTNVTEVGNASLEAVPFSTFENYLGLPNLEAITVGPETTLPKDSFYWKLLGGR